MRRAYGKFRKFYAFSFDNSYFIHNRFLRLFALDSQLFYALFQMFQAFFRLFTPFFIFWILSVNSQQAQLCFMRIRSNGMILSFQSNTSEIKSHHCSEWLFIARMPQSLPAVSASVLKKRLTSLKHSYSIST